MSNDYPIDKKELKSSLVVKFQDFDEVGARDVIEIKRRLSTLDSLYSNVTYFTEQLCEMVIDHHSMMEARELRKHDPDPDKLKELTRIVEFIQQFANSPTI